MQILNDLRQGKEVATGPQNAAAPPSRMAV